ncbi:hypothetical protein RYX36_006358, partial [Vicia faba]
QHSSIVLFKKTNTNILFHTQKQSNDEAQRHLHCHPLIPSSHFNTSLTPRRLSRRSMANRPRHLLRRKRRLRNNGSVILTKTTTDHVTNSFVNNTTVILFRRRVWLREFIQPRLRRQHGGIKHCTIQQRLKLRRVF